MSAARNWLFDKGHLIALFIAFCALAPSYWTALSTPAVGIYHDDSLYINTARALAEGRGYFIESTPTPLPQTKYPILFPALLALVWKIQPAFPDNVIWFKAVPMLAALVWFWLSYILIGKSSGSNWLAASAVAATAASPHIVFVSTTVLSETLFAALTTAALLVYQQYKDRPSLSRLIGCALLASAAYHTRTIGFCLVLAIFVALLLEKHLQKALQFGIACAVFVCPWIWWQLANTASADPYLSHSNYYSAYNIVFNFAWSEKIIIALTNLTFLPFSLISLYVLPWGAIAGFIALPFGLRALFMRQVPLAVRAWLLASAVVIALWVWPPLRFLLPLLPAVAWSVWAGTPLRLRRAVLICAWLLAAQGILSSAHLSAAAAKSGFWLYMESSPGDWFAFVKQMDWIRNNSPANAIVQSNVDPTVFLFTGRRAIRGSYGNASLSWYLSHPQPLGNSAHYRDALVRGQVSYIVDTPWPWFLETKFFANLIDQSAKDQPSEFQRIDDSPGSNFRVFRFTPKPATAK